MATNKYGRTTSFSEEDFDLLNQTDVTWSLHQNLILYDQDNHHILVLVYKSFCKT